MKERHITPNLKPDERFVLQLKVGQSYIKSTDTELKTEQTTTDPVEAKTYSGNYLNTTVWEWSLHCVAIPLKKLPKAPLHAQRAVPQSTWCISLVGTRKSWRCDEA